METTLGKIYTFLETLMEIHLLFQIKNGLGLALPHFIKNLGCNRKSTLSSSAHLVLWARLD